MRKKQGDELRVYWGAYPVLKKSKKWNHVFQVLFPWRVYRTLGVMSETCCILTAQWSCYGNSHVETSKTMVAVEIWWCGEKSVDGALQLGSKIPSEKWGAGDLSSELLEVLITKKKKAWITCLVNAQRSCTTILCSILPMTNESISIIAILIWSHCWLNRLPCKSTFLLDTCATPMLYQQKQSPYDLINLAYFLG